MEKIQTEIALDLGTFAEFHKFIQSDIYESFLLDLLNKSNKLANIWGHVSKHNQSNGEADFKSKNEKYSDAEATLLLDNNFINNIRKVNSVKKYIESKEFSDWVYEKVEETIIKALDRKNKREIIILFNIFPMQSLYSRFSAGVFMQFAADGLDLFINSLIKENLDLLKNKEIFIVSYNMEGNFLLKQLYPLEYNEFIPFYDARGVFPLKVKNMKIVV